MAKTKSSSVIESSPAGLKDVAGERCELIFELAITDYSQFRFPLFRPAFHGAKWPTIDCYVELLGVTNASLFFFAQIKSTMVPLKNNATALEIKVEHSKCARLVRVPGPT